MRTTIDLPALLFQQLQARAARDRRTVSELVAEFITAGLQSRQTLATPTPDPYADDTTFVSAFDAMQDGIGLVASGATDLATNPAHAKGFGRD